jgi:hypothetical protein
LAIPTPEHEWIEETDWATVANARDFGAVMRGNTRDEKVRLFHLNWEHATQTKKDALFTEVSSAKGAAGTTSYTPTPIGAGATTVRILEHSAERRGALWRMSCVLLEQYTPY